DENRESRGLFADHSALIAENRREAASQRLGGGESAGTPDSVPGLAARWRPSLSAGGCPPALAAYPGVRGGPPTPCSALLRVGFTQPPGSPRALVRSYRTVSPLPVRRSRGIAAIGGLLSVALSCGSPRLGVTQHLALWSPDVPRTGRARTRPPGRLTTTAIQPRLAGHGPWVEQPLLTRPEPVSRWMSASRRTRHPEGTTNASSVLIPSPLRPRRRGVCPHARGNTRRVVGLGHHAEQPHLLDDSGEGHERHDLAEGPRRDVHVAVQQQHLSHAPWFP